MKNTAAAAIRLKPAHSRVGPRATSREMKEMETTPARMRVVKSASDMALARRRLGKTSVPTTYTSGEKPSEKAPMMPHTPTTDSQSMPVLYENDMTPKETASPNAEMSSIGRRPTRSNSCDASKRNRTLHPPAPIVANSASKSLRPTFTITSGM
eukprot:scaffold5075_cov109-Isochrysis_galbana.AAC.4